MLAEIRVVKWGQAQEARPTQRGDGRQLDHERNMVERTGPHTGYKACGAIKHREERSKPYIHS